MLIGRLTLNKLLKMKKSANKSKVCVLHYLFPKDVCTFQYSDMFDSGGAKEFYDNT